MRGSDNNRLTTEAEMIPPLLRQAVKDLENQKKFFAILDVGCGEGEILSFLKRNGLLTGAKITGIDINKKALQVFKKRLPEAKIILADVSALTNINNCSFNMVVANQVIEHFESDRFLALEVYRILKKGGLFFVSSVLKKKYGWYWHRNKYGKFVIAPTHLREYSSPNQLIKLLKESGFTLKKVLVTPGQFHPGEYFSLLLKKIGFLKFNNIRDYYSQHPKLYKFICLFSFPLPGYAIIEIIAKK